MRTTITKTVQSEQINCDHCGKEVVYSAQACIVCGQYACNDCFQEKLTCLDLEKFPKFWPPLQSIPTFHAYACKTCSNKITRRFNALAGLTARRNEQCERWHRWYLKQIKLLLEWQAKADKKHGIL